MSTKVHRTWRELLHYKFFDRTNVGGTPSLEINTPHLNAALDHSPQTASGAFDGEIVQITLRVFELVTHGVLVNLLESKGVE